jgi:hypothetical protein
VPANIEKTKTDAIILTVDDVVDNPRLREAKDR